LGACSSPLAAGALEPHPVSASMHNNSATTPAIIAVLFFHPKLAFILWQY
jgi:hypothetical protein